MVFRPLATRLALGRFGIRGSLTAANTSSFRVQRSYATQSSKESGPNIMLFVGLTALGGAAHHYYKKNPHVFGMDAPVDYEQVYKDIADLLENNDYDDGSYGPVLVRLAWHAAGTFDKETNTGGINGASMRFEPEALHGANNGLKVARDLLEPIKAKYPAISYGDLWSLAGICAIQQLGGPCIPWRPGRTDGTSSSVPDGRLPDATKKEDHIRAIFYRMGFNDQEIVALTGAHALGRCHPDRSGFDGPWSEQPTLFSNEYFKVISERQWVKKELLHGGWQWVDKSNPDVMMLPAEIDMLNDKVFRNYFELYAKDEAKFFDDFAKAFGKLIELGVPFKGNEKVYTFKTVDS